MGPPEAALRLLFEIRDELRRLGALEPAGCVRPDDRGRHERPNRTGRRVDYRGVWGVLADWFRVPVEPPTLPVGRVERWKLSAGTRLSAILEVLVLDLCSRPIRACSSPGSRGVVVAGYPAASCCLVLASRPNRGLRRHPSALRHHLVCNDRPQPADPPRHLGDPETTITFENIQNVSITQGPVERAFGIATLVVDTAGGGDQAKGHDAGGHRGTIEGVADAERLRRLILQKLSASRSAGLGEEVLQRGLTGPVWDDAQLGSAADPGRGPWAGAMTAPQRSA